MWREEGGGRLGKEEEAVPMWRKEGGGQEGRRGGRREEERRDEPVRKGMSHEERRGIGVEGGDGGRARGWHRGSVSCSATLECTVAHEQGACAGEIGKGWWAVPGTTRPERI